MSVRIGMFCRFGSLLLSRPGRRDRLVEAGVHAAGVRVHERGQRVDVRALELLQAAPLEDELGQLVRQRQLLEHFERR